MYDVKGGTRAVIFDRLSGVKEQVVNEGTHFLIPWLQKPIIYDVRTKPRNISTTTGSKDLQMVSLTLRVLHRPDVQMLPKIYQVSFSFFLGLGITKLTVLQSLSDWIMTNESCHLSVMKSSRRSLHNSTQRNSLRSEKLSRSELERILCIELLSLISRSRMFLSRT